jgi:hypothetical protein
MSWTPCLRRRIVLNSMSRALLTIAATGSAALAQQQANTATIQNSEVAVTIDLTKGCAVSAMWAVGDAGKTNTINTYDLGRYVQASYYSGPQAYGNCSWSDQVRDHSCFHLC